jgi:hypothetical protein
MTAVANLSPTVAKRQIGDTVSLVANCRLSLYGRRHGDNRGIGDRHER